MAGQMTSRRDFLGVAGGVAGSGWLALHWPAIVQAAEHAEHAAANAPAAFTRLTPADAADVEAIAAQIVPSGRTPGAREARVVYFVDRALKTFFAARLPAFRAGLTAFQKDFAAQRGGARFAAADSATQIAYLRSVETTEFFWLARTLTVLGLTASPSYGGNYQHLGWKLMGFADEHAFLPPFGYYDRDYPGFVPYPPKAGA